MNKYYIKIIVEGNEESTFFDIVNEVGKDDIFVLEIENANGYGGIPDAFLNTLREDIYDCVICVYDVDDRANDKYSPFNITRKQLTLLFGDENITDAVSFCTNPNILQYFLLACDTLDKVELKFTSKASNTPLVKKYWKKIASGKIDKYGRNIKSNYDASKWQLDIIKFSILNGEYNYEILLENASLLPINYKESLPSGNLLPMLNALKKGDVDYFKKIQLLIYKLDY